MQIAARRFNVLSGTPALVGAAQSKDELFRVLAHCLRSLFAGPVSHSVYVIDDAGRPRLASSSGTPSPVPTDLSRLPDVSSDTLARPALHAVRRGRTMIAPLVAGRRLLGLIEVATLPGREFGALDLQILEGLAGVFTLALLRFDGIAAEQAHLFRDADRRSASETQRRLMHQTLSPSAGVRVDTRYLPALDVGGDFFEVADLGDGRVGAAIGDVVGKGVAAALIMSRVSSDVRREMRSGATPARVLQRVNADCTELGPETFVTASCIRVDARHHTLTVANAGHLPLVVRRTDGTVFEFGPASGTPLGVMSCDYVEERIQLAPNDIVLLLTDGLADALDHTGEGSASQALRDILRDAPHEPSAINSRILEAADSAANPHGRDDVTLVALQLGTG